MSQPYIITIILNTSRREDTLACLTSLAESTYENYKVIVLDNASTDGSVEAIRCSFPKVQIIRLTENLGYAGNNNVGINAAMEQQADWIFLLNEDTILEADCISRLIEVGESDPSIGIIGPMVYHHDEPNIIQSAGGKLTRYWEGFHIAQNEPDQGQYPVSHLVDWIHGCAILVRNNVVKNLGMLDERFFYYWEETEWCLRTAKKGWLIFHVPQAKLWHKGVQRDYQPKPSVTYYNTRNHFMMLAKHKAPLSAWTVAWGKTLRTLASWSLKPKWKEMHHHRNAMLRGTLDFLRRRWGEMAL